MLGEWRGKYTIITVFLQTKYFKLTNVYYIYVSIDPMALANKGARRNIIWRKSKDKNKKLVYATPHFFFTSNKQN